MARSTTARASGPLIAELDGRCPITFPLFEVITYYYEYHFLYITGIEHVESKSIQGASLMKLVFHPGTDMSAAMAEVVGYVGRARAFMPPGTVGPFITRFDAGSVPVGQLVFTSTQRSARRIAGHRAEPRPAAVCDAGRRLRPAALRRQSENRSSSASSRRSSASIASRRKK